jgi:RNA polymerase sigma-70 factor (ECF subfamily)
LSRGDTDGLEQLFAEDAVSISDGGGEVKAAMRTVRGRKNVLKLIWGLAKKLPSPLRPHWLDVNAAPALAIDVGPVPPGNASRFIMRCELDDEGRITELEAVLAPSKLTAVS